MWLASILQQLYFISWKERRDSCAIFGNGSETCQEWPSPRSFKVFVFRRLPTSHVKATAPCRPLLPLRNSGERLWRRTWRLEGRGRTRMLGCECLHTAPAGICPLGILPERCLPTVLAASFPQELELSVLCTPPPLPRQGAAPLLCQHWVQCFLCISTPAEHKTVLKYYSWCSQYFGFSDLRINSDIKQCWKIISSCEGRVSPHWGDEVACLGWLYPQLHALFYEALVSIMWQRTSFLLFLSYGTAKLQFILLLANQVHQ